MNKKEAMRIRKECDNFQKAMKSGICALKEVLEKQLDAEREKSSRIPPSLEDSPMAERIECQGDNIEDSLDALEQFEQDLEDLTDSLCQIS